MGALQTSETAASSISNPDLIDRTMSITSSKESTPLSSLPSADTSLVDSGNSYPAMQLPPTGKWSDDELQKMAELLHAQWEIEKESNEHLSATQLFTLISKQMGEAGCYRSMDGCRNQWYSVLSKQPQFQNTFSFSNKSFDSGLKATSHPANRALNDKTGDQDENSVKKNPHWTDDEENKLFELLKARLELEKSNPDIKRLCRSKLFDLMSKQLKLHSIDRTPGACLRYWNRHGEQRTGLKFDFDDQDESEFSYVPVDPEENRKDTSEQSAFPNHAGGRPWTDNEYEKLLQVIKTHLELESKSKSVEALSRREMFGRFSSQLLDLYQIQRSGRSCEAFWDSKGGQRSGIFFPRKSQLKSGNASHGSFSSPPRSKAKSPDIKKKRAAIRFLPEERAYLTKQAWKNNRPNVERREQMAAHLGLPIARITGFFGNWRTGNYPESRGPPPDDLTDMSDNDGVDDGDNDDENDHTPETSFTVTRAPYSTRSANGTSREVIRDETPLESAPLPYGTRSSAKKRPFDEVDHVLAASPSIPTHRSQSIQSNKDNTNTSTIVIGSSINLSNSDGDYSRKRIRTEENIANSSHVQTSPRSFRKPPPVQESSVSSSKPAYSKKYVQETEEELLRVQTDLSRLEANVTNASRALKDDNRRLLAIEKEAAEIRKRAAAKETQIRDWSSDIEKLTPTREALERLLSSR